MEIPDIIAAVSPREHDELVARIGANDTTRLGEIMVGQPFDAEFRVADVTVRCGMTQAGASKLVQRLVEARVVTVSRVDGRNRYYALATGAVSIALGIG